jgi:hypothetical protein
MKGLRRVPTYHLSSEIGPEAVGAFLGAAAGLFRAGPCAGADAYPGLVAVDEDLIARPPTAEEVTIAEAIALALIRLLAGKKALLARHDARCAKFEVDWAE